MSSHGYNSRNNTPPTENQTSQQSNVSTDQSSNDEMSLITHLESILLSHFDNLSTEFLNLKDIIIKNLQIENERLRNRVSYLNKRIVSLESDHNLLKQYGRRNNIKITGIPYTVQDNELENKVIGIFNAIGIAGYSAISKTVIELRSPKITLKKSYQDLFFGKSLKMPSTKGSN